MLRKFYEAAAEEAKASETNTEVINNTSTEEAKPPLAEAMAKSGTKVEGLSKVDNPLVNKEEAKEETKATETDLPLLFVRCTLPKLLLPKFVVNWFLVISLLLFLACW